MNNCPKCNSPLLPSTKACPSCGEVLSSSGDSFTFDYNTLYSGGNEPVQQVEPVPVPTVAEVPGMPVVEVNVPIVPETQNISQGVSVPVVPIEAPIALPAEQMMEQQMPVVPATPELAIPVEPTTITQPVETQMAPEIPGMAVDPLGVPAVNPVMAQPMMPAVPSLDNSVMPEPIVTPMVPMMDNSYTPPVLPSPGVQVDESKSSKMVFIGVSVISLIAIVAMLFFMIKMFSKDETKEQNQIGKATQYNYEGFEFYLPDNVVADVVNGEFVLSAVDTKWHATVTMQSGSYNTLVSNKAQLKSYYEKLGYVVTDAEEKEISGTAFVTMEVTMGSDKVLVAYSKASGIKLFGIVFKNEAEEYDNDSLKDIGKILSTMNFTGHKYNLPEGFTIDMFKETFKVAE
jgi:hypothetical protein